ncbi:hypothetical protein HPB49_007064 [Dermacentor silvarum]|uniref:Uncharacterized protein n=1 Tax=Dermacentor silvarum TaxID=543639 RepID=A0ACB8D3N2_DERSI|nr:hypothetical protein HPB49_007064 [Dermacentor silvarum]
MACAKRQNLLFAAKLEIINRVERGEKKSDVAAAYKIPRSTLSTILKNKADIRAKSDKRPGAHDFIGLPCATFYKAKSHHATKETADRLLEKIASRNVSDIGESDDEDDIPQEDVPRENCDMPSSSKGEDGDDRLPLKEIHVEDNVPKNFQWKKKVYVPPLDTDFSGHNECPPDTDETCTPYTYFSRYVPESIFKVIAENTNQYIVKTTLHNVNTTSNEVRKLFGMHILMGVIHLPRVRLYWNPMMKVSLISETMKEKHFFKLRNNLHIVAKDSGFDSKDRLWKVRPFLELIRKRCLELAVEQECSIDEQMIPFKGHLSIKQYVKGKPSPWGIKVFALCGRSGLLYDFAIYQGEHTIPADLKKEYGLCSGVVLHPSKRIPYGCNCQLYFDNYFTSVPLLRQLRQYRILAAGTVRKNRLGKCPLESKKVINKKPRGYSAEYVTSDDVVVVIWKDKNDVSVASNFVGIGNEEDVRRWDKTNCDHIFVKQPEIIAKYNRSMGGVDKMDFLLSLYRTKIRSKKWTLRAIFHFVDLAVCNAWMEYLHENAHTRRSKLLDLLHFRLQIAEALISSVPNTRSMEGLPTKSNRRMFLRGKPAFDSLARMHATMERIIGQKPRTKRFLLDASMKVAKEDRVFCKKCEVPLCMTKDSNCYYKFHT